MKNILVTGAAGFIGFHLSKRLLQEGNHVVGLDNLNDYYSVSLKKDRLKKLDVSDKYGESDPGFHFEKGDLADRKFIEQLFKKHSFDFVINLAAQAGVRYSIDHPHVYIDSNIQGFLNLLEGCRDSGVEHLVYASSSSVYGMNKNMPFKTSDRVDNPVSLYAATKKSNELMAHTYSHLYGIPATGLRFFTVYGPWGRPDMALFLFTKAIINDEPIKVFNHGDMQRDFTYVDDIVESIIRLLPLSPGRKDDTSVPHKLFNIGHNSPVELMEFIHEIEKNLGKEAKKEMLPMQPGDVPVTWADVSDLFEMIDYKPQISIEQGVKRFIAWYRDYYKIQ